MKIVRKPVLKNTKKAPIAIIIVSIIMLLTSLFDISIIFNTGTAVLSISTLGIWSTLLSIIPLSWALCTFLLLKFKKNNFAKIPSYITCAMIGIGYIIYFIIAGQKSPVTNVLLFSLAVLLIYPFIIATLTLEGRLYNRVFAAVFSIILLAITFIGAIIYFILKGAIIISLFYPALMYVELLLIIFCFKLEKPIKKPKSENIITH